MQSSTTATVDPWQEFDTLRHNIKQNTVDRLKQIISGLNDECQCSLSRTGKKQELIDRVNAVLDQWRQTAQVTKWVKAKAILHQVRSSGMYTSSRMPSSATLAYVASGTQEPGSSKMNGSLSNGGGRYDPSVSPRKAPVAAGPTSYPSSGSIAMRFQPSPFLRVEQQVSDIVECPESTSAMDRRQQHITFSLNREQVSKLSQTSPKYQLRLYCTSNTYYAPGKWQAGLCPMEFPPTCEVRVNSIQINANLKGLKKRPGTAPPAYLDKTVRLTGQNRVEMVYVNSLNNNHQGTPAKKYYMVVQLVEVTTVEQLVDRTQKGKFKNRDEILQNMKAGASNDDDDIVAGPQKMSLKDPLTFVRVGDPCRGARCPHPQCFDVTTWFTVMEQTTTFLCPICEQVLDPNDLIIDGYFRDILQQTPDSVDEVMVEADGEWHTIDNKYASPTWKSTHSIIAPPAPSPKAHTRSTTPKPSANGRGFSKRRRADIVELLDSDDEEDEGIVKRELSPRCPLSADGSLEGTQPPASLVSRASSSVIDLTVDSDDERTLEPVPRPAQKRKASNSTEDYSEQTWKKSRSDLTPNGRGSDAPVALPMSRIPVGRNGSANYTSPPFAYPPARPPAERSGSASGVPYYQEPYSSSPYESRPSYDDGRYSQQRVSQQHWRG